jgi:uncharacterized protein YndB with AHSA1/START domain
VLTDPADQSLSVRSQAVDGRLEIGDAQPTVASRPNRAIVSRATNGCTKGGVVEYGSIEREIWVDAAPEVVFDVVSNPEYIADWWLAQTDVVPVAGSEGDLVWVDQEAGTREVVRITVADAEPSRLFSFRWTHPHGEDANVSNSLLVRFELNPRDGGTLLRMTETGFRQKGWEAAVLEEQYNDHVKGWAFYLPRLQKLAESRPR